MIASIVVTHFEKITHFDIFFDHQLINNLQLQWHNNFEIENNYNIPQNTILILLLNNTHIHFALYVWILNVNITAPIYFN